MKNNYVYPEVKKVSFNCPHCNALSHQFWSEIYYYHSDPCSDLKKENKVPIHADGFLISQCYTCRKYSIWRNAENQKNHRIYPEDLSYFPKPNLDLPEEIKTDYFEGGKILKDSPRGTAALLRLCVQKLVNFLEPENGDLNQKIKKLVKKGLDIEIQRALDLARVIGNEAVHPGLLDLKDDKETVQILFESINLIAEKLISYPRRIKEAYEKLPPSKLEEIKKRDSK